MILPRLASLPRLARPRSRGAMKWCTRIASATWKFVFKATPHQRPMKLRILSWFRWLPARYTVSSGVYISYTIVYHTDQLVLRPDASRENASNVNTRPIAAASSCSSLQWFMSFYRAVSRQCLRGLIPRSQLEAARNWNGWETSILPRWIFLTWDSEARSPIGAVVDCYEHGRQLHRGDYDVKHARDINTFGCFTVII